MESVLNVSPGLMIWTLLNFLIFLFLLIKFGAKPISEGLKRREENIRKSIEDAHKANQEAQRLLRETNEKMMNAHQEMVEIVRKGKEQAESIIRKAEEDSENVKKIKVEEAIREINRTKELALLQLKSEVADMVVTATEKLLGETLDKEKHHKLAENFIEQIPNN